MADYKMYAYFTAEGEGKAGLTVTITVYNSAGTEMVASGSATGIAGGLYRYTYSNATADDYIGIFKTTDTTVDAKHVPAMVSKQQPMIGDPVALTSAYDAAKTAASQSSVEAIPTNPLLADDYVAPDNASIAAIDNKMDNLPTKEYADELKDEVVEAIDDKPVTPVTDISNLPTKTELEEVQDNIISAMPDIDVSAISDDILNTVVVDDMTVAQVLKVLSAVEVGTVSGGGGATFSYTGKDGTKITLSGVDENGNRAAVNVEFE